MTSKLNAFNGLLKSVQSNGLRKTFFMVLTLGQPKIGKLVGVDEHKNEYYENRTEVSMRDRWILYNKWNFDATQIPPQWHQWLHRMTDDIPSDKTLPTSFFTPSHVENVTGSSGAFKTYNTVKNRFQSWVPQVAERK